MKDYEWHEIRGFHTMPLLGVRCMFELRSGFRFYGERIDRLAVQSYGRVVVKGKRIDKPTYSMSIIRRWRYDKL